MMALEYMRKHEWSMGNGQCPECHGVHAGWHGHPLHKTAEGIGHKESCKVAQALSTLGEKPLMIGEYKSEVEYESYIADSGALSTRPKTEDGCPRIRAINKEIEDSIYNALMQKFGGT